MTVDKNLYVYDLDKPDDVQDANNRLEAFITLLEEADDVEKSESGYVSIYRNSTCLHFKIEIWRNAVAVYQFTSEVLPKGGSNRV